MIETLFENDKRNFILDEVVPHKSGIYLFLATKTGDILTVLRLEGDLVAKVKAWCVKARYRCPKIDQLDNLVNA